MGRKSWIIQVWYLSGIDSNPISPYLASYRDNSRWPQEKLVN